MKIVKYLLKSTPTVVSAAICLLLLMSSLHIHAQDRTAAIAATNGAYEAGEKLFKSNCSSCHKVNAKMTGPALAGVYDKYEAEWLHSWVKNSQAMVKAGDPRAVQIYNEYKLVMTSFPTLQNADIDNILAYVKVEADFPPTAQTVAASPEGAAPAAANNSQMLYIFLAAIAVLLAVIAFTLGKVVRSASNLVRERNNQPLLEPITAGRVLRNRWVKLGLGLLIFGFLSYTTYDNAQSLGRQKNYQPEQPIKFSHQLHAGKWGIDCQYCHSGANKGKTALIPSANVCMNCHKAIDKGPKYGTKEISKIYAAIGWDKDKKEYIKDYEQKPIEWVRIHNLPDHVYFNHAQHVNAGKIACQKCHGEIQEMEVVKQQNSLGMGWCITCHRETEVQFSSNDYYSVYEKYHKELKEGKIDKITVEKIGGVECQKCHY
ncbi:MAG: c-type cytochrome [Chitinophagales bacterium]|nr:c-type cytochrome [Bacteroidota bacterium]MCB9044366.1 c-type cytochrome [Chitinophagales bacterium]